MCSTWAKVQFLHESDAQILHVKFRGKQRTMYKETLGDRCSSNKTVETERESVTEERESSVCENRAEIKKIKC